MGSDPVQDGLFGRAEIDTGTRPGVTTDDRQRLKELERENL